MLLLSDPSSPVVDGYSWSPSIFSIPGVCVADGACPVHASLPMGLWVPWAHTPSLLIFTTSAPNARVFLHSKNLWWKKWTREPSETTLVRHSWHFYCSEIASSFHTDVAFIQAFGMPLIKKIFLRISQLKSFLYKNSQTWLTMNITTNAYYIHKRKAPIKNFDLYPSARVPAGKRVHLNRCTKRLHRKGRVHV